MNAVRIGILHPGAMGACVAATLKSGGHDVLWVSERRSGATRGRAASAQLRDVEFLTALCQQAEVIISICPPASADEVAQSVASRRFKGIFVDANAIAPDRARRIGEIVAAGGGRFVDGGIIGLPMSKPGATILYLSGPDSGRIAALFASGPMTARDLGGTIGRASALKMCYAAFNKGATAMLAAVLAAAEAHGVRDELFAQWTQSNPDVLERARHEVPATTAKAWRFVAEMQEIAATFRAAGLPGEFHDGAREIFARLASFKNASSTPELAAVLAALLKRS